MKAAKLELEAARDKKLRKILGAVLFGFCPEHVASTSLVDSHLEDPRDRLRAILVGGILRKVLTSTELVHVAFGRISEEIRASTCHSGDIWNALDFAAALIDKSDEDEVFDAADVETPSGRHAAAVSIWNAVEESQ